MLATYQLCYNTHKKEFTMRVMQTIADFTKHQPVMVLGLAGGYCLVPFVGKAMCEGVKVSLRQSYGYYDSCPSACQYPKELSFNLVAATTGTTALDSVVTVPVV
jgi:hypothetical protein